MNLITILSIVSIISIILNITLFLKSKKNKENFNNEVKHETCDINILKNKMEEMIEITNNTEISNDEKLEKMSNIAGYCEGYLSGVENHLASLRLII